VARSTIAVDCCRPVTPGLMDQQIVGGMVHMDAAPWGRQTFTNVAAEVKGLNRSRMMRTREMPQVRVVIIPAPVVANRTVAIGGIGEPGVPTFSPTPANACFKLMGMQQRSLLFFPSTTMSD